MPQKKNPDVPELVRGKSARVAGHLVALLMLMKAQPLAYNKDNQEDKEPLFDTVDTLADVFAIMTDLVGQRHRGRRGADARRGARGLSPPRPTSPTTSCGRGVPFRDAHEAVARAVRHAEGKGVDLDALSLAELRAFLGEVGDDVHGVLTLEGSVAQPRPRRRHRACAGAEGDRSRARFAHRRFVILAGPASAGRIRPSG